MCHKKIEKYKKKSLFFPQIGFRMWTLFSRSQEKVMRIERKTIKTIQSSTTETRDDE